MMSDKKEQNYIELLDHLELKPCEFIMIGNSCGGVADLCVSVGLLWLSRL